MFVLDQKLLINILLSLSRSRNILDDFREAYFWLRQNTDDNARYVLPWSLIFMISRS